MRQRIRSFIEEMLEAELEAVLQRRRYERAFAGNHPHAIWLADITSVVTDEGWLYLAAVKDLAAGEIVGWGMADHLKSSLCESALLMAIHHRAPPVGLIHPSDRGVQYACEAYRKILDRHGFQVSMSGKGDGYDNAPMESSFGSLKTERVHLTRFRTRREAKAALFECNRSPPSVGGCGGLTRGGVPRVWREDSASAAGAFTIRWRT